jgi:hypothetical protein
VEHGPLGIQGLGLEEGEDFGLVGRGRVVAEEAAGHRAQGDDGGRDARSNEISPGGHSNSSRHDSS